LQSSVLVVDDEPGIVEFVELNLKKEGFYVLKAYKGRDAITITREEKPDIIVLDIMLPDIDGFEVCRSIREFSNVPVIMLTAKGEDLDKWRSDGAIIRRCNSRERIATQMQG